MTTHPRIGAILITQDEQDNIADCLAALSFCNEIVIVDGGSSDRTVELAEAAGAKVTVRHDWAGFGIQKQRALDLATTDWVLSIDADERITPDLAKEILSTVASGTAEGYRINRQTMFLGKALRHGGWYPDRVVRLARRDACRFTDDIVHETLTVDGRIEDLRHDMIHHSYRRVDDVLRKQRQYALASAEQRRRKGRRGGLAVAMRHGAFAFAKAYFAQTGFLDGRHGFVAALSRGQETFWRYLALGWDRDR